MTAAAPPCPWLVADIGGTNARFGWVAAPGAPAGHVRTLHSADHADAAAAARVYLDALAGELGSAYEPPRAAAFAVATAVEGDRISFTNSAWSFSRHETQHALALERLELLNDFEALALALPALQGEQLRVVGTVAPAAAGARAVIGPGTGLGVAGLVHSSRLSGGASGGRWVAVPGEGGHATLAAGDDFDSAVIAVARRACGHVSAERLLSGIGLPLLHRAVAEVLGVVAPAATTEQIVADALAGSDALAVRTLECFCALLGGFAGDVALTFGARGGLYIGGGIVPRLGALFERSAFRARFEAKGRFAPYLRGIATAVIVDTLAALAGAAAALAQGRA
ncbi:MAG TPA: glucokinase [Rubrivivax sp.]|nr:glucokinase [Rubrivivax sp.]